MGWTYSDLKKVQENNMNFKNRNVCITGTLKYMTREDAVSEILAAGGHFDSTVKNSTHYLVVADNAGATKLNKAKKLGTTTLTEAAFTQIIKESKQSQPNPISSIVPKKPVPNPIVLDNGLNSREW